MASLHPELTAELRAFIAAQQLFFVASAPLGAEGHVNVSPRGLDAFRVVSPASVAYLDLTGSGNETSAHLRENGRLTVMFCAFEGPPRILRLFGRGAVALPGSGDWDRLRPLFGAPRAGERQIVHAQLTRIQTSCGFGVPRYRYLGERDQLPRWAETKEAQGGLTSYQQEKNARSIDGLPTHLADREGEAGGDRTDERL